MSVAAMTAVWRYSQAPNMATLLVLLAMADWADDEGYCFPSHRAIMEKTGGSLPTVKRAIRDSITRGEVERVATKGHTAPTPREFVGRTGFKATNLYRIVLVDQLGSQRPEFLERNGVKKTPVKRSNRGHEDPLFEVAADREQGSPDPVTGVTDDTEQGSPADLHIRNTRQIDTSDDTSDLKAGVRPRATHDDDPEQNLNVIIKLAHEVLDLYAGVRDCGIEDVTESVKVRCATLHIAYWPGDVVQRAINAAVFQRQRAGKPAVLVGSSGNAAFRLQPQGAH